MIPSLAVVPEVSATVIPGVGKAFTTKVVAALGLQVGSLGVGVRMA
jgi:hypothetical protein